MTRPAQDEDARLAAVHSYRVLDQPRPAALDELTRLAASIFDTPMSAVSIVDRDRQWFAGNTGFADDETPHDVSFCASTVARRRQLVVPDARLDPRFSTYRNVTGEPHVRFYAGSPLLDEDGHALGALCVVDSRPGDLGPRQREALDTLAAQAVGHLTLRRTQLLLTELGEELARAAQREEDLIATVSHELRTPVAAIQGYLELLAGEELPAGYDRFVEPIQRNGERLVRMVDHLLTGARPAHAPGEPHRTQVDLTVVAEAARRACGDLAERRGVDLSALPAPRQVVVRADITQLTHAVQQLVRNAVLFTPAGGAVTVSVAAGPAPAVEVADTGVGVPADELPYVFQRFYRGRHARQEAVPGVGLGLHIARQAATAHGGTVTLTSGAGGTTARLSINA
ncbi:GAF domain-containing sensor histidine kinase [Dactylosporangium aurantiacum]|uniref:histidine kinase n=1 Tax=Dactylosporangium aurantiacum TaxID=35754 RepID=A0A9Q9IQ85_9ACTN|nr:GAF domain-containing sensor histidine kinase [Dactylosporangium aurantiacum]MDG6108471.1 GAF domain-containing sensor histidine kinase [Dactylosporangium aurantiacum]UWZ57345.1 GAF domain-containing sensor histidine kinase [Dactylosporangium aurantiacum]